MAEPSPVWLLSLRREHSFSGEHGARAFLLQTLGSAAILQDPEGETARRGIVEWLLRPLRLNRRLRDVQPGVLVLKVPTLGQLALVQGLTWGFRGRVILWIEGLCWTNPGVQILWALACNEPLLTIARMVLNRPPAASRIGRFREFIVASRLQKQEILAHAPTAQVHCLPTSIRMPKPKARLPRIPGSPLRIGYLGHSYLTKGVGDLLQALEQLQLQSQPFRASFAFSDLGSQNLRRAVARRGYEMLGQVDPATFFQGLDIAVFPYWTDWGTNIFPNVLLECLHAGVPVVTTDLPMTREFFGESHPPAIFVPPRDPSRLAEVLADLAVGRRPLPTQETVRRFFAQNYDPERIGHQWTALLAGYLGPQ